MNNKGQVSDLGKILFSILAFGFIIFLFLFLSVGLKQIMSENVMTPVRTTLLNSTSSMISAETVAGVNSMQTGYDRDWFNYDLFFLLIMIIYVINLIYSASRVQFDNIFTFFGVITIFNMGLLFALTFLCI